MFGSRSLVRATGTEAESTGLSFVSTKTEHDTRYEHKMCLCRILKSNGAPYPEKHGIEVPYLHVGIPRSNGITCTTALNLRSVMVTQLRCNLVVLVLGVVVVLYLACFLVLVHLMELQRPSADFELLFASRSHAVVVAAASPRVLCLGGDCKDTLRHRLHSRLIAPDSDEINPSDDKDDPESKLKEEPPVEQPDQSPCVPTESWQTTHHPLCNTFHEANLLRSLVSSSFEYIASGGWRDVWRLGLAPDPALALKLIKWKRKKYRTYTEHTYRRHIVDALASDRLSGLNIATGIYGFCGLSVLNDYGDSHLLRTIKLLGDVDREQGFALDWKSNETLTTRYWMARGITNYSEYPQRKPSPGNGTLLRSWPTLKRRVQYARDAALNIAAMRSIDWRGGESFNVTLVHHDIKPDNFIVLPDGGLRLNDFNDAELIHYNITSSGPCRFRRKKHNGNYQSPEEAWELPLSHTVDLHTLGGVLYFILLGKRPYFDLEPEFTFAYLSKQVFPLLPIGFNIEKSGHLVVTTMLQLIRKLRSAHPAERPEASLVVQELDSVLEEWQAKLSRNARER